MTIRIPVVVKIGALVVATTALYTYLGQLVPQKEVQAPVVIELASDLTTAEIVDIGRGIFEGKGLCSTCHTIGKSGVLRFPDLDGVGARAAGRVEGLSALEYLAQSVYEPDRFIVPGFNPGMKVPKDLSDQELLAVIAYLQSLGGTPTVTMQTEVGYSRGG